MRNKTAWKNNSHGSIVQFDFAPPANWDEIRLRHENLEIATLIASVGDSKGLSTATPWLELVSRMPKNLRDVLTAEISAGNSINGVGMTQWPSHGSVVVNVRDLFQARTRSNPLVHWRNLNDPHYCREEVSAIAGGVEHLLLT